MIRARVLATLFFMIIAVMALNACITEGVYAPVTDANIEALPKNGLYKVYPGDTLYSIAWRYGLDYRMLAHLNHIDPPFSIHHGRLICLNQKTCGRSFINQSEAPKKIVHPSSNAMPTKIIKEPPAEAPMPLVEREPTAKVAQWKKPAAGPIIGVFSVNNKGVNIGGHEGDPIYATARGKVVYCGNGLRGYGNLIIIKHNGSFLSAYAHNNQVLVKEGEWVRAGQPIATMGNTGSRQVMLHFEIRRDGKPVNPLSYF